MKEHKEGEDMSREKLNEIKFLLEEFELGGIDVFALIEKIELIIKIK